MNGFYKLDNEVLKFDVVAEQDKILFNHYIMQKENRQRLKKELPKGQFYLSENIAAKDLNFSRSKINRLICNFKELGIISVIQIFPKHLRVPSIYEYLVTNDMSQDEHQKPSIPNSLESSYEHQDGDNRTEHQNEHQDEHQDEHQKPSIPNSLESSYEHQDEHRTEHQDEQSKKELLKKNSLKDIYIEQSEILWRMYPVKKGKSVAIKKLPKLIEQYGYEQMERCVTRYADSVKGRDTQYIKHGSTFFNGGYMDYLDDNYQSPKPAAVVAQVKKPNNTRFTNISSHNWDFDELERLEQEYIERKARGEV